MLNIASKKERTEKRTSISLGIETILSCGAIALLVGILLKAVLDVDNNYDPGWYHLPFAARLGGIVPKEMFIGEEKWFEPRFDGFPLLAHTLQGFFWRITGRIQSTNLVGFLAILGYFAFLRVWFKVPWYLATIAILAIPLVQTNASTSFVDLLGNVGTSILVMMTYRFYLQRQLPTPGDLAIAVLGAAIAVNTKTQLQPLVFVILFVTVGRLAWLYWQQKPQIEIAKVAVLSFLAAALIFASPIKNTIVYANPLYPIKVQIGSIVLNHKLSPDAFETGNRQLNWLTSILEINAPIKWSPDQYGGNPLHNRRGGFFGLYVVFNLLLLWGFYVREAIQNKYLLVDKKQVNSASCQTPTVDTYDARTALLTAIAMSLVPLNFPQSHELRYFMYWGICLVSLNLYLVSLPKNRLLWGRWLQPKYMGLVCAMFLTIVLVRTDSFFVKPSGITLDKYIATGVRQDYLDTVKPNEKVCLISRHVR